MRVSGSLGWVRVDQFPTNIDTIPSFFYLNTNKISWKREKYENLLTIYQLISPHRIALVVLFQEPLSKSFFPIQKYSKQTHTYTLAHTTHVKPEVGYHCDQGSLLLYLTLQSFFSYKSSFSPKNLGGSLKVIFLDWRSLIFIEHFKFVSIYKAFMDYYKAHLRSDPPLM